MVTDVERVDFGAGPWVKVACLCAGADQDADERWTVRQMLTCYDGPVTAPGFLTMPILVGAYLFVQASYDQLDAGYHELTVRQRRPDGSLFSTVRAMVSPTPGPLPVFTLYYWYTTQFDALGIHWLEISMDAVALTRFPVEIKAG